MRWSPLAGALLAPVVVAAGCGTSHEAGRDGAAPRDAGSAGFDAGAGADAGPDVTGCDGILDEPPEASCPEWLECSPGEGFCMRRRVTCPDGRLHVEETAEWTRLDGVDCPDTGPASMTVATPDGDLFLESGVASFSHGFAVDLWLIFFNGTDVSACGTPRLSIAPLVPDDGFSYLGTQEVTAALALDEELLALEGECTISLHEMRAAGGFQVGGTCELAAGDVRVVGDFLLTECLDLDRGGP